MVLKLYIFLSESRNNSRYTSTAFPGLEKNRINVTQAIPGWNSEAAHPACP